jgi:phage anti-repressor protein
MLNIIEKDNKKFVSAKDLYTGLELNVSHYSRWAKKHIIESKSKYKDYSPLRANEKGKGNFSNDYLLSVNFAKFLCTTSGSEVAVEFVEYLISLENQKQDGFLLSHEEILALQEMVVASHFKEFRDLARDKHLNTYLPNNPQPKHFGQSHINRNTICGIDKYELEQRLNKFNIKYTGVEKALITVDKYELIRISVIDTMLHFGKTKEYAINIGNLAKELSKSRKDLMFTRIKDTLFPIPIEYQKTVALLK